MATTPDRAERCHRTAVCATQLHMAGLPDAAALKVLRDEGLTFAEIAQQFGVTPPAVITKLRRAGLLDRTAPDACPLIPWKLGPTYRMDYHARMLRLVWRQRQGKPISEAETRKVTRWLEALERKDDRHPLGMVVTFSLEPHGPEHEPGFAFVERLPSDEDIVRP